MFGRWPPNRSPASTFRLLGTLFGVAIPLCTLSCSTPTQLGSSTEAAGSVDDGDSSASTQPSDEDLGDDDDADSSGSDEVTSESKNDSDSSQQETQSSQTGGEQEDDATSEGEDGGSSEDGSSTSGATTDGEDDESSDEDTTGSDDKFFELTSAAFIHGEKIPLVHACADRGGTNISPELVWNTPPAGTRSYALVFVDLETDRMHLGIWDISPDMKSMPEAVEQVFEPAGIPGAKQAVAYTGEHGFEGPCPYKKTTYEFVLHALDVEVADGLDGDSSAADVVEYANDHSLGSARLAGSFAP